MTIEIQTVSRTFGDFVALREVSLHIPSGELVALLGPSGSGKTTLLKIIAGLDAPDPGRGRVIFHETGEGLEGAGLAGSGHQRVGFVFQHYALFRHMTVFENVAFGLRVMPRGRRPGRAEIRRKVTELLRLVQLEGLAERFPAQLSGGQRQRIALARSLAVEPRLLLLDEPFGALDAKVRQELRKWLRSLHDQIGLTSVFVTHDQEEAMELADRVVILNQGRIEQVGTPDEVFQDPATEFVLHFLGNVNLFHGRIEGGKAHFGSMAVDYAAKASVSTSARVFVRPHDFEVDIAPGKRPSIRARIERVHAAGPRVKLDLRSEGGEELSVELAPDRYRALGIGAGRDVYLAPREIKVFVEDYSI